MQVLVKLRVGDGKTESKKEGLKDWQIILVIGFIIFMIVGSFLFLILLGQKTSQPMLSFHDGATKVTLAKKLYHPNDTVELKVEAEALAIVTILSIELDCSIKGLQNLTLYSIEEEDWAGKTFFGRNVTDTVYCDYVLPQDLDIEKDTEKLYFTIKIRYVHPHMLGLAYYKVYETEYIAIDLEVANARASLETRLRLF